jgi:chromate reductase
MNSMKRVGVLIGSLRKEAFSRKVAKTLMALAPADFQLEEVEIGDLAMFNQDFDDEGRTPAEWTDFRKGLKKFDAFLFVTPEYNRSVPAVLKNALDIGSRPYGKNVWDGKPGAVVSVTPGALGAFGSNHHLRQTLMFLNVPAMPQPEVYIANAANLFGGDGALTDAGTREFLQNFMAAFAVWVGKNAK